ncbi:MAG TPA: SEC59/DGK1/VTE5 family protein [Methanobacterium sp.]|nr:SEC59/DGK1/VTE5 family protein [Methanobacterium sp.]
MEKEYIRQLIHASGIFIVFLSLFLNPTILILICIIIVIFVELLFRVDRYRNIFFISSFLDRCKRKDDEKGFVYFFLGIILTIYFFQFNMAVVNAAIIILLFGDSASTIIGKKYGKAPLPLNKQKTIIGTLAFFIVAFIGALTQLPVLPALIGAIFGAITEAYSPIDDNIPIPLISALAMSIVIYFI